MVNMVVWFCDMHYISKNVEIPIFLNQYGDVMDRASTLQLLNLNSIPLSSHPMTFLVFVAFLLEAQHKGFII